MQRKRRPDRLLSGDGGLAHSGAGDDPMKRQDRGEVGAPQSIVGFDDRGCRDAAPACHRRDVDHKAKIQMPVVQAQHDAIRCLGDDREDADLVRGRLAWLQPEWSDDGIAQRRQGSDPEGHPPEHTPGGTGRIERTVGQDDAVGIGELRAGKQLRRLGVGGDFAGFDGGSPMGVRPVRL